MEVFKGKETVYAVFHSKKALRRVEKELKIKIGKRNVQVTTIRKDAREKDIVDLIPTWFDVCLENPYAGLIKEAIKSASTGKRLEQSKREKIKGFLVKHPMIVAILLDNLEKMYKYNEELMRML